MSAAAVAGAASAEGNNRPNGEGDKNTEMKRDSTDNDIKDYAETTMNELLGWYGYDKLDSRSAMNLKALNHPSSSSSSRHEDDLLASEDETGQSASPPAAENEYTTTNTSGVGNAIVCAWCLKMGLKQFTLKTGPSGETKEFCSEACFDQCRRAAFKKNRVCNWCRHVRHTVNYVDFQDGDDQLQFCGDKCLNQYKMQIFCRETQAYLQSNPHLLQEETNKNPASSKLITPDLWLRDCQQEPSNGAVSSSGDELHSSRLLDDKRDLEDLSTKSGHNSPLTNQDRETYKNISTSLKDNLPEICHAPFQDEDKSERRKRHHEIGSSYRKRQRTIPSFRNKLTEAPPAHLSSTLTFPKHSSPLFPSTSYPQVRSKSPVHVNPPAAHSKSFTPHHHPGLATTNPVLHPGLPPPPPLLNNDYYHHSPFNPQMFTTSPHQQQLDSILRMHQAGFATNPAFTQNLFNVDSMLHRGGTTAHQNPSIPQTSTVMLPFPIFVPLPVPIPIPLPLRSFLPKEMQEELKMSKECDGKISDSENAKNSKSSVVSEDSPSVLLTGSKNQETVAVIDSEKITKKHKKR